MRIAVVSDIHGNRTAFEAVLADLRDTAPDLTVHGGDLADGGSSPVSVVDQIRDLGWMGVMGNTDEMLVRPAALEEFAQGREFFVAVGEMAAWSRSMLGEERLAWMAGMPRERMVDGVRLLHASPGDLWRAPGPEGDLSVYDGGDSRFTVYGHIHRPFVRGRVANSGSAGLPYDGDRRASYLLIDDGVASIRRVEYDVEREVRGLRSSGMPRAEWTARMLGCAGPLAG